MSKKYAAALQIVEAVLAEQPDLKKAWFLKAQALAEGFDHQLDARRCLVKEFQAEPKHTSCISGVPTFTK